MMPTGVTGCMPQRNYSWFCPVIIAVFKIFTEATNVTGGI